MQSIDVSEVERHGEVGCSYTCFETDDTCLASNGERFLFFGCSDGKVKSLKYSTKQIHRKLKAEDLSKDNKHAAEVTVLRLIKNVSLISSSASMTATLAMASTSGAAGPSSSSSSSASSSSSTTNPNYLASGSSDRSIRLWSVDEVRCHKCK